MPPRKEAEQFASSGTKDCWHPYGLQNLSPEKFVAVVSRILAGKFNLLDLKWNKELQVKSN
nr:hypothetical protein [candidate division Zixibacteria bacterium]